MNLVFNNYFSLLFETYENSYPIRTQDVNEIKDNPWITPRVKECIKKKSRLYRMFVRGAIPKESYTYYRNRLTTLLKRVRRLYFYKLFRGAALWPDSHAK